ncbi:MAG: hypothetical protein DWP97_04020, partial [Calditrichaeota bacterium]
MSLDKLKKLAKEKKIQFLDIKFTDLPGFWHHITLPVSSLEASLFKNGVGVDGSSLPGFSAIEKGDMILIPDTSTAFVDPFFDRPTLSMIADIMEVDKQILPYSRNPRRIARDAEAYLQKVVKGSQAIIGPEFEF